MKLIRISSSWCTSCIVTYNTWTEIQKEYSNYEYIEYDYDLDSEVSNYNVGNILPVIIVLKDNNEVARIIGEKNKKEIIKILEEVGD